MIIVQQLGHEDRRYKDRRRFRQAHAKIQFYDIIKFIVNNKNRPNRQTTTVGKININSITIRITSTDSITILEFVFGQRQLITPPEKLIIM